MSSEKSGTFDLRYLSNLIWFNKLIIFVTVSSALFFGLNKIQNSTPIFESFVIFESDEKNARPASDLAALVLMQNTEPRKEIPKILGRQFLSEILEDQDVKLKINKHCDTSFSKPSLFSVSGLLDRFGIYKLNIPTENQLHEKRIECIRQMIIIETYVYKDFKTDARKLTVKSSDPKFSAFLANRLARSYLSGTNADKNRKYEAMLEILSEEIKKIEQAAKKKEKDLSNFVLENAGLFGFLENTVVNNEFSFSTPILAKIANDMKTLRDLEEKLEAINASLSLLIEADEENDWRNILNNYLDFSFSAEFEKNIGRYNSMVQLAGSLEAEKKQIIETEKNRLKELRGSLKQSIAKVESAINENTVINSRISVLNLEIEQMKEKLFKVTQIFTDVALEASYEKSDQREIHSIAVPAINPSSPKITLIIFLSTVCGILIALTLTFVKQAIFQNIYTARQMLRTYKFLDIVMINGKKLKKTNKLLSSKAHPDPEDLALLSKIEKSATPVAFLEIGTGLTYGSSIADRISLHFTKIMALKPIKILLMNRSQDINSDFLQKEFKQKGLKLGSYEVSNNELLNIQENTLFPLEQKYDSYDKIIISIDKDFESVEKFHLINQCEKLVLVSKIGKTRMKDYSIFFDGIENYLREKCLGLILVK